MVWMWEGGVRFEGSKRIWGGGCHMVFHCLITHCLAFCWIECLLLWILS